MTAGAERRSAPRPPKESRHHGARGGAADAVSVGGRAAVDARGAPDVLDARRRRRRSRSPTTARVRHAAGRRRGRARREIDPLIAEAAEHWRLERMNVLDRLICGSPSTSSCTSPRRRRRSIINEALELARTFSARRSVRFINGVLDAHPPTLERE